MQKTVRAPGLRKPWMRKPLLLHRIHDIHGRLCIIGNTISILRQMHGDLMAVAAPSLEKQNENEGKKGKERGKKAATKTHLWKKISSRVMVVVVVVLFFLFLFFIIFFFFFSFLLFHIVYVREEKNRKTTRRTDSSSRPSRSDGGEKRPSLSRTVANGLRDADLRTAVWNDRYRERRCFGVSWNCRVYRLPGNDAWEWRGWSDIPFL